MGEIRESMVGHRKYAQQEKRIMGFKTMKEYREYEKRKFRNESNALSRRSAKRYARKLESNRKYRLKLKLSQRK
jgi:hypothetical protein